MGAPEKCSVHELEGQNMVLSEAGTESQAAFEDTLKNAGVGTNVVMEIDSRAIVRDAVAEGIGIGVAGEQALVPDGRLRVLKLAMSIPRFTTTSPAYGNGGMPGS